MDARGWHSEHPIFKRLIDEVKPKVIVELGTWKGASALHMAKLSEHWVAKDETLEEFSATPVYDAGPKIYCVDTFLGGIDHDLASQDEINVVPRDRHGYPMLYHLFLQNVVRAGFQKRIVPVTQTSTAGVQLLKAHGITCQLAYVDADHTEFGALMDMDLTWNLLVEPGGVMFGDDLGWASVAAAVGKFAAHIGETVEVVGGNFWIFRKPLPFTPLSIVKEGEALWPKEYISDQLTESHCLDVLQGAYDLPYNPATPPVILDVGANVGAFCRWAVKRWPGCEIHAYEPHGRNYGLLLNTIATLTGERVHPHNEAVSWEDGKGHLNFKGFNCGEFSLIHHTDSVIEIDETILIDAASLPKADILKLDVEGYEYVILKRLGEVGRLKEFSAVVLEYHSDSFVEPILKMLREAGFNLYARIEHSQHRGEMKFLKPV